MSFFVSYVPPIESIYLCILSIYRIIKAIVLSEINGREKILIVKITNSPRWWLWEMFSTVENKIQSKCKPLWKWNQMHSPYKNVQW